MCCMNLGVAFKCSPWHFIFLPSFDRRQYLCVSVAFESVHYAMNNKSKIYLKCIYSSLIKQSAS